MSSSIRIFVDKVLKLFGILINNEENKLNTVKLSLRYLVVIWKLNDVNYSNDLIWSLNFVNNDPYG